MFVVDNKKIFFVLSGLLVALSFGAIAMYGLPLGIDFTGGSVLEVSFQQGAPSVATVEKSVIDLGINDASVRQTGENGYIIRTRFLDDNERNELVSTLGGELERFSSVGPTISTELREKAFIAIFAVVVLIVLYIAFVFRKVSEPVSSWKYGVAAVIALVHDIAVPTGVIVVLGHFGTATADTLFVMALLAILGLSVNDTIVVFDRIRENLVINKDSRRHEPFEETVGRGLNQTYVRSINTSLTTIIVLLALFFIGGPTIHNFVLTLIVGMIVGTYSSIFLASPLLLVFAGKNTSKK